MISPYRSSLLAEFLGTLLLVCIVLGSGIMAQQLAQGNQALALLANTLATAMGLFVLIELFLPISGAHFNPVVSLVMALMHKLPWPVCAAYIAVQVVGGVLGALLTNLMFELEVLQIATTTRAGYGLAIAECVATFGLLLVILIGPIERMGALVACYIGAAYWFTASTSFANPAVTLGRVFSDTFAGIDPSSVLVFVMMQLLGGFLALRAHVYFHAHFDIDGRN